jgi:citrate synthase
MNIDQDRKNNQHIDTVDAREAAALLGVKLSTLYAYVSRGAVRSLQVGAGRKRRYLREDLARLRARSQARAGHGAVAAAALRWGEPVLDSRITALTEEGPAYRGRSAVRLAEEGRSFDEVAALLWGGTARYALERPACAALDRIASVLPRDARPVDALAVALPILALGDSRRLDLSEEGVRGCGRGLLQQLAAALALTGAPTRMGPAVAARTVAGAVVQALGVRGGSRAVRAVDHALVLCADHELNASTFAARVAASAGADLYACVAAALATFSGPVHGGACDRVEALVAETRRPERARAVVHARLRRGETIPGFGHPLYPRGDPRAQSLLALARRARPAARELRVVEALAEAMGELGGEPPSLDAGLVAVAGALAMPPGSAMAVFAVGRAAGWIAHVIEQRAAGFLLRPRARYVGGAPLP